MSVPGLKQLKEMIITTLWSLKPNLHFFNTYHSHSYTRRKPNILWLKTV